MSPPWSLSTRIIVIILVISLSFALILWAFPLVQALVIAVLLAILLDPLVCLAMRKLHLKRGLASALVYFSFLILLAAIPATFGTLAYSQISRLGTNLQNAISEIEKWATQPVILFGFDLSPRTIIQNFGASAGSALTSITGNAINVLSGITTNFLWILLVLVSLYYLLKDGPKIKPWIISLASPAYQEDVTKLLDELDRVWVIFIRFQLLIFLILAILFLIGASLVVWLYQLGLIPFSTLGLIVMLVLVLFLVQQVDGLWLRPQILGSQLSLHPGIVFISLIGALAIGGVLAAIVIVPLLASIKVIGHYVRSKLLGLPPWPEEPTPVAMNTETNSL